MDYDKLTFEILVRDINTGETLTDVPTGTHQPTYPSDMSSGIGPTTAIALRPDGAVAWIVANTTTGGPGPLHYEVWAARGSDATQIATGTDIDPTTLSINATAVTWSQAGQPASAQPAQIQGS